MVIGCHRGSGILVTCSVSSRTTFLSVSMEVCPTMLINTFCTYSALRNRGLPTNPYMVLKPNGTSDTIPAAVSQLPKGAFIICLSRRDMALNFRAAAVGATSFLGLVSVFLPGRSPVHIQKSMASSSQVVPTPGLLLHRKAFQYQARWFEEGESVNPSCVFTTDLSVEFGCHGSFDRFLEII